MVALCSNIHEVFLLCISLLCPEHTPGGYLVSADLSRVLKSLPEQSLCCSGPSLRKGWPNWVIRHNAEDSCCPLQQNSHFLLSFAANWTAPTVTWIARLQLVLWRLFCYQTWIRIRIILPQVKDAQTAWSQPHLEILTLHQRPLSLYVTSMRLRVVFPDTKRRKLLSDRFWL